ncbi:hypothetical protein CHPC1148_0048 [Streptococcus phage CHPC1148]|uniref:Uncharacterized protein n=1 Tax=Streptococcus phage CHPC1148 TaxID=2365028 RepID=A0A3G8FBA7_9CAUD|nr:hypothetical protein PP205_gp48 [Streptococcus phage CHPC1148]AZF92035.1 hypothetical protein CHPC1148_0048 [Streptococcus phage CHPC1148]
MLGAFFIYHHLYFKFQSCYQQCKAGPKKYVWIPLFYKIFTGFVYRSVSDTSVEKKLPSHDRLTASEGVEPSNATRIKNLNYSDSYAVITSLSKLPVSL